LPKELKSIHLLYLKSKTKLLPDIALVIAKVLKSCLQLNKYHLILKYLTAEENAMGKYNQ